MSIVDEALGLAALGIPVFPLRSNKRPCVEGGFKSASDNPADITRMFSDPAAVLIGVPTGPASGYDALDIDPKNGGDEWLRDNAARLPLTRRHMTRSGGSHFLFNHRPGMRNSASRVAPGVDIRGDGGYIVWWPAHGCKTFGDTYAEWPAWLLIDAMKQINPSTPAPDADELAPPDIDSLVSLISSMPNPESTTRDDYTAFNLAVQGAIRGLDALGKLDDPTPAYDAAAEWSARWESDRASDFEAERKRWDDDWSTRDRDISGWRQLVAMAGRLGVDVSRHVLASVVAEFPDDLPPEPEPVARPAAPAATSGVPAEPSVNEENEDAVASGFAADLAGTLVFDHSAGQWYVWDATGGVWRRDDTGRAFTMVRLYCRQVRALFGNTDKKLASVSFWSAVERAAKYDPRLATTADAWDTDPWLLGVPGGVVDLRTGHTLAADPKYRISKQTLVAPAEPGTPAPLWDSFMQHATGGDAELIAFLYRLCGYCLSGVTIEEIIAFVYGLSGTGKGTLFGALLSILGGYAVQTSASTFAAESKVNKEYQAATMAGARFVMASETKRGVEWDESLLKELSGNEGPIPARLPYGKPFTYRAQFKIVITGNNAPILRGYSDSMERRLRVTPFRHKPARKDTSLKERLISEYPAILRRFIDGCLAWQRAGLGTCTAVAEASRAYFADQDASAAWANERLAIGDGYKERRADLYNDFVTWARAQGEPVPQAREFYESLRQSLGMRDLMSSGVRYMVGAGLRSDGAGAEFPEVNNSDVVALIH